MKASLPPCLVLTVILSACTPSISLKDTSTLSGSQIMAVVDSPDRSEADRTNDLRRKPAEMIQFIGIRRGITAEDLSAGGGYTTELLARAIGPTGKVYGQSPPRRAAATPPAAPEGGMAAPAPAAQPRPPGSAVIDRAEKLRRAGALVAPMQAVVQPFEDPVPPNLAQGGLDLVTLMFNYHDLGHLGVDRAQMNRAVFRALKPGGLFVIADHSGRPGTGITESGTLHRVEEAFLRREVEAAGFKLLEEGQFLRNPEDPRTRNTPEPPMPKDEFVLKFVKPQ